MCDGPIDTHARICYCVPTVSYRQPNRNGYLARPIDGFATHGAAHARTTGTASLAGLTEDQGLHVRPHRVRLALGHSAERTAPLNSGPTHRRPARPLWLILARSGHHLGSARVLRREP
jgi:hypothetical protein